jgi:hypothetical protein
MSSIRGNTSTTAKDQGIAYRLHIQLLDIEPAIWREVIVPASIKLPVLHHVLQIAMGWDDGHMHDFAFDGTRYGGDGRREAGVALPDALGTKRSFEYTYDFGDDWRHAIKVNKVDKLDPARRLPFCVDGERACPPEDVGGPWGYANYLEAIGDPSHEEHEDMLEWGGDFDPEEFDLKQINRELAGIRLL